MGFTYTFGYNLSKLIARTLFSYRVVHPERIIETGGALLAMNHQSYLDPPLAGIACKRQIHYLARKTLLKWPILGPLFPKLNVVPVDQDRADMSALKTVIKLVKAGNCTIVFPEGSRTLDGRLQPAQPGLGLIIAKTLAPVVPMRIFGAYEAFPSGAKFPKRHPITIVVGEPLYFTEADLVGSGRDLYQRLSERVMQRIASIEYEDGKIALPQFRGPRVYCHLLPHRYGSKVGRCMRFRFPAYFILLFVMLARVAHGGSLNDVILQEIREMPTGGSYSASHFATIRLESAAHFEAGKFFVMPDSASPSYCSGATYLVFLKTVERLRDAGLLNLNDSTLSALMVRQGQRDGEGIWGRWNANGPGTARLFFELGLGRNFTEFSEAQPGDFMKIFWNDEVGKLEHGHSVIYLGTEKKDGVDYVRFWSSNIPAGYGEKSVPRSKIVRAIFSRLETPQNLTRVEQAPDIDAYLFSLQTHSSSFAEAQQKCGF